MGRKKEPSLEELKLTDEKRRYARKLANIILEENTIPTPRQINEYTDYEELEKIFHDYDYMIPAAKEELKSRGIIVDAFGRVKDESVRLRQQKWAEKRKEFVNKASQQPSGFSDFDAGMTRKGRNSKWTREELKRLLKEFYDQKRRLPTGSEIASMEGWPSSMQAVSYYFGSKENWYDAIGVPRPEVEPRMGVGRKQWTRELIVEMMKDFYQKEERLPTGLEIEAMKGWPRSATTVFIHLGNKESWYKAIGVPEPKKT